MLEDAVTASTTTDWWEAEALVSAGQRMLTEDQISRWLNDGFLVVTGLWPPELVERAMAEARALHSLEQVESVSRGFSEMPWTGPHGPEMALNQMTIHPRALGAVSQLLGTPEGNLVRSAPPTLSCPLARAAYPEMCAQGPDPAGVCHDGGLCSGSASRT